MTSEVTAPLLLVEDLHVTIGDREVLRGVDLASLEIDVNIDIPGLPDLLRKQIDKAIEETSKEAM